MPRLAMKLRHSIGFSNRTNPPGLPGVGHGKKIGSARSIKSICGSDMTDIGVNSTGTASDRAAAGGFHLASSSLVQLGASKAQMSSRTSARSEARRVGSVSVRVALGGRRIIKKQQNIDSTEDIPNVP